MTLQVAVRGRGALGAGADFSAALRALLLNYDRDTISSRSGIRQLLDRDPKAFYAAALTELRTGGDSRAGQFVIGLLASANLLLPALRDASLSRKEALVDSMYQPPSPGRRTLKIRVHTPFGWGQANIAIPPEPP